MTSQKARGCRRARALDTQHNPIAGTLYVWVQKEQTTAYQARGLTGALLHDANVLDGLLGRGQRGLGGDIIRDLRVAGLGNLRAGARVLGTVNFRC